MRDTRNTEFFIARRLSERRSGGRPNIMVRIATVTVAISMAVMIIALAVISGFKGAITDKLVGFGSHVQIVNLDGNASFETVPIRRNAAVEEAVRDARRFSHINAYAVKGGIIKTDEAMQGVMLKGVDGQYDWTFFADNLVEGELPRVGDSVRTKDMMISRKLSRAMKIGVDDRVEMLFVQEGGSPRRDRFKITGIYDSGFEELDMMVVVTDMRNVQRLGVWDYDQITGYELAATDFRHLDEFSSDIFDIVSGIPGISEAGLMMVDVRERYPNMFDWLKAHNMNAAVIIVIMLLVSLLSMVSALLIILLERTRMIGVLKALGMKDGALQRMFVIRSAYIMLKGMVWGNIAGIGLCLLQKYTGLVRLSETGYYLTEVPIRLDWEWLVAINAGTFVVMLLLLAIPTKIISGISPEKTIRYQ